MLAVLLNEFGAAAGCCLLLVSCIDANAASVDPFVPFLRRLRCFDDVFWPRRVQRRRRHLRLRLQLAGFVLVQRVHRQLRHPCLHPLPGRRCCPLRRRTRHLVRCCLSVCADSVAARSSSCVSASNAGVAGDGQCVCSAGYCGVDCAGPCIGSLQPTNGGVTGGYRVTIHGQHFDEFTVSTANTRSWPNGPCR